MTPEDDDDDDGANDALVIEMEKKEEEREEEGESGGRTHQKVRFIHASIYKTKYVDVLHLLDATLPVLNNTSCCTRYICVYLDNSPVYKLALSNYI